MPFEMAEDLDHYDEPSLDAVDTLLGNFFISWQQLCLVGWTSSHSNTDVKQSCDKPVLGWESLRERLVLMVLIEILMLIRME